MIRRLSLVVCLAVFAVPLFAIDTFIPVRIDMKTNRAYIPEGTVLPGKIAIRAAKVPLGRDGEPRMGRASGLRQAHPGKPPVRRLTERDTMIFEYAPESTFTAMRARYAERFAAREKMRVGAQHDRQCSTIYSEDTKDGLLWSGYTNGFASTLCMPAHGPYINGNYYNWDFTAAADYADEGFVYVDDVNGNYTCQDSYAVYGLSCTDGAYTQWWWGSNTVTTAGSFSIIEYQQNYEPYYIGYYFETIWYTAFY